MPYLHDRIIKHYLILCEGTDTKNFVISYLNSTAMQADPRFGNDIQVFDFHGINELSKFIKNLKNMENYEEVTRLLVLRDAETDVQSAIASIKASLEENDLPIPDRCNQWESKDGLHIQTAFTLMPNCSSTPVPGALEDLCWSILKGKNPESVKNDVQSFIGRIKSNYDSIGSHEHKSRLHTYFSINKEYISLKIGEAAKAGAFDWEAESLSELKKLIEAGF